MNIKLGSLVARIIGTTLIFAVLNWFQGTDRTPTQWLMTWATTTLPLCVVFELKDLRRSREDNSEQVSKPSTE